ncbi:MAG: glycosyltransferase family 4 protein [Candidatus Peregrinibacteria bacterium]|nr:glycosyltransferase family 4 protein [Candidatus Peregrinibacteria bacterium]
MIYIDASRYSNTKKRTGVENYSYFLIGELIKSHGEEITLVSPRKINLKAKQIIIPFPRLWTQLRLSWEIFKNQKIDNLFVPSHVLPLITPKKSTITIHDVVFKYSPESYSLASRVYLNWSTKFAVKHATSIIVPSEATKKDLITFYKASAKKIHVIPLGFEAPKTAPSTAEEKKVLQKLSLETGKYFLYIGRIEHKKNSDNLIKAFQEFSKTNPKVKLVLAGKLGHGGEEILSQTKAAENKNILITGYVSEEEKSALLNHATAFIFPSRFEGFGLPLLEAMHHKLPIIASDIPTSKEIMGGQAHYFEVDDSKGLVAQMEAVMSKAAKQDVHLNVYGDSLKEYSWKKCSDKVYQVLSSESA